jgi:hypothetical protein
MDHEWAGLFAGIDHEWRQQITLAERSGVPVFIYPHSVRPNIPFDLTDDFYPGTRALFTIAEGHKEILRRLKYPHPIEVMGWPYTEIKPFRHEESSEKTRVLFAPIHPVGSGFLPDVDKELNAKTYELLLGLMDKIHLSIRHIQSLEFNGLWEDRRVRYINGALNGSTQDMDDADVVIGAFTFAHMAVALGRPLIMVGEGVPPHNSPRKTGRLIFGQRWDEYKDYLRYPHNVEDCQTSEDLYGMMKLAMEDSPDVEDWKERFIGQPFDGKRFVKTLESYL